MEKLFTLSLLLMSMVAAQAQLKVAPKLAKGMSRTYSETQAMTLPGQAAFTITDEMTYTITDNTVDGYLVDVVTTNIKSDAAAENMAAQLITASCQLMQDVPIRVVTDKDGKILKLADYATLSKTIDQRADQTADKMLQAMPQLAQALPKDMLKQQIMNQSDEESLLKSLQQGASCDMMLNGKTVMTGGQESYVNHQGLKMKRMYFVNGRNVTTSATLDMTRDELKALIIAQVEQSLPDQAATIKQNIDQLIDSGMFKFEMKEKATLEFSDDCWPKTIKVETVNDTMGQQSTITTTVTAK